MTDYPWRPIEEIRDEARRDALRIARKHLKRPPFLGKLKRYILWRFFDRKPPLEFVYDKATMQLRLRGMWE